MTDDTTMELHYKEKKILTKKNFFFLLSYLIKKFRLYGLSKNTKEKKI